MGMYRPAPEVLASKDRVLHGGGLGEVEDRGQVGASVSKSCSSSGRPAGLPEILDDSQGRLYLPTSTAERRPERMKQPQESRRILIPLSSTGSGALVRALEADARGYSMRATARPSDRGRLGSEWLQSNFHLSRSDLLNAVHPGPMGHDGRWTMEHAAKGLTRDVRARRFVVGDSVEELTALLHRSYADHAAAGRVFFASYQSVQDTAHRVGKGECWLAFRGVELVGSVTVAAPCAVPEACRVPADAGSFWQLAVDPTCRGIGLGQRLLALAEERIVVLGSADVVIDTSAKAVDLVDWYRRRGYVPVGTWRWDVTNYDSVVLLKELVLARHDQSHGLSVPPGTPTTRTWATRYYD